MKTDDPLSSDDGAQREETAGMWLARRDRGLTPGEQREFDGWLKSDARHGPLLEELEFAYRTLDRTSALRTDRTAVDPDFLLRRSAPRANATCRLEDRVVDVAPALWRRAAFAAIGMAAVLIVALFLSGVRPDRAPPRGLLVRHVPERKVLPDGSTMELATGSAAEVLFTAEQRRIVLTAGHAHFSVKKDPARPFVVSANGVAVHAVGTAFTVSCAPTAVEVVVAEGRVRVDTASGANLLEPASQPASDLKTFAERQTLNGGERVRIEVAQGAPAPAAVTSLTDKELENALSWRNPWLKFAEMPLSRVVEEFNSQAETTGAAQVRLADDATGRVLVSGTFRADGLPAFVRVLASSFDVTSSIDDSGNIVLHKTR